MRYAIVRPPSEAYVRCVSNAPDQGTIVLSRAVEQHRAYCEALKCLGLEVISLPPLSEFPDACFVEDTAVVRGDVAVIGRPGLESRRGEEEHIVGTLSRYKRIFRVTGEATLEGGDVLQTEHTLFVGLSQRTNWHGIRQLLDHFKISRCRMVGVSGTLHLKTLSTYLGRNTILAAESCPWIREFKGFEVLRVPTEEAYAANALAVGNTVLLPRGYPVTNRMVTEAGFQVLELDMSEFRKGDGGMTCLSILL